MSRTFSCSSSILGIIEDIEICRIRCSGNYYRPQAAHGIEDLAKSIREKGLLQPIIVRTWAQDGQSQFQIIAGNRRYQACKSLGWKKIISHIVELDDREAFELSLIENIQRKTLSPIEEANGFKAYVQDFGWGGISDLAKRIGKSISYVNKRVRLLNLPSEILERICDSGINPSVAEELIPINDDHLQNKLAEMIFSQRLSSRKARKLIKEFNNGLPDLELPRLVDIDEKAQRSFDKAISVLKIATSKLGPIVESMEDNWIVYEILMQHRFILHSQIDLLIKQKKKI